MPTIYNGKLLSDTTLPELELYILSFAQAEKKREDASQHPKFVDNKSKKYVGEFPPINPKYLELKNEILKEIESRK